MNIYVRFLICLCLSWSTAWALPSVAFHYGSPVPVNELSLFDWVVVEPEGVPQPPTRGSRSEWFAYVSVGEVVESRHYFKHIPASWLKGINAGWSSHVIDQSAPDWPVFFNERIVEPLWRAGYRAFFLDTLDSWQLIAKTDLERQRQREGLAKAIKLLKQRHPEVKLIFNRGFEILPELHPLALAVTAESLFEGWNAEAKRYQPVSAPDREWLLTQLNQVKNEYGKPIIVIDYVPSSDRSKRRETVKSIKQLGFIPWVSVPSLDQIGSGLIEHRPRRLLMLWDSLDATQLIHSNLHRYASMPASWLGYRLDYFDIRKDTLPKDNLTDRYAGAILWSDSQKENPSFEGWLTNTIKEGLPLAVFSGIGIPLSAKLSALLGWKAVEDVPPYRVMRKSVLLETEARIRLPAQIDHAIELLKGEAALTLIDHKGQTLNPVGITPWGGYALSGFEILNAPGDTQDRWLLDPFVFLKRALRLPPQPVPDITTVNGRRLLMAHVDGDGFASRAEFGKHNFAGAEMLNWLQKNPLPTTVSIVEGEIAASGLYPQHSPQLEAAAKEIFALPHVEIASHSYSHPFKWQALADEKESESEGLNLPIKNYAFSLEREILGSVAYITQRLAPPGKKVKVFLWSGDCNPDAKALELIHRSGLLSMNGGDTLMSKTRPSLTATSAPGIWKGSFYQVYAPNQNENVYTNLWRGPFYGYRAATETFELTDSPRRLKPVDIYYHTYSFSKLASLKALQAVYDWVVERPFFPVYSSEYIRLVHESNDVALAQTETGWRLWLGDTLRTVRIPKQMGYPDLMRSKGVVGFNDHGDERYLATNDAEIELVLQTAPPRQPYLDNANGRLIQWQRTEKGIRFGLASYQPLHFRLGNSADCTLRLEGRDLSGRIAGHFNEFKLKNHVANSLQLSCPA